MTTSGAWACAGTIRVVVGRPIAPAGTGRSRRYAVVGTVMRRRRAPSARASTPRVGEVRLTLGHVDDRRCVIASVGQACTHAGASPSARRSAHMSHLRTMPVPALNRGTS